MSCPYFITIHDTRVCNVSSGSYIPSLNEMGGLCFKDDCCECTNFRNGIIELSMQQNNKR